MIQFAVFSLGNALIITAAAIVALYALKLYRFRVGVLAIPALLAILWAPMSARNPSDWVELGEIAAVPLLIAPLAAWLFYRRRITSTVSSSRKV